MTAASSRGRLRALCIEPRRYDERARAKLAMFADVDWVEVADQQAFVRAAGAAPYAALIVRLGVAVDADVLAAAPALRFVCTPTTGLDHVDLTACGRRDIRVLSLKGEEAFLDSIRSTAEHTWALLLALCRKLPAASSHAAAGGWEREPFLADELAGKTLGVVGCGRLGRMVAGYGLAFGMQVLVHDIRDAAYLRAPPGALPSSLDDLLRRSDVVSLHVPLDPSTTGMLDTARIASMKHGAFLVNTARGEVLDEAAVAAAVRDGRLGGVAVDVLPHDARWGAHVEGSHPLLDLAAGGSRVIVTPHCGGYGRESIAATREFIVEKLKSACEVTT